MHHNPTPGLADPPYVYGHVFVFVGLLAAHPARSVIALPLLSRLYVRKKYLPDIDPNHRPDFRTKLELAVELLRWAKLWLGPLGEPLWVVADGAYAEKEFIKTRQTSRCRGAGEPGLSRGNRNTGQELGERGIRVQVPPPP